MAEQDSGFDLASVLEQRLSGAERDLTLLIAGAARLGRIISLEVQRSAREEGLETSEHSVLMLLWIASPDHPLSPTELSELIVQTTSGMTKTLRRLEEAGLVSRAPDLTDGRRQRMHLTEVGAALVERRVHGTLERWDKRLRQYPADRRRELAEELWSFVTYVEDLFLGRAALGPRRKSRKV